MAWSSTTRIARISQSSRDAAWRQLSAGVAQEKAAEDSAEPICYFALEGDCKYGDKCTYSHNITRRPEPIDRPICYYALAGDCKYGLSCGYSHDFSQQKRSPPADQLVCCYFLQGKCKYGATCEYSHDLSKRSTGCSFGAKCHLGHLQSKKPPGYTDSGLMNAVRGQGNAAYLECHGPSYDDTDPLWEEVSCALRGEDGDIGDADLISSARERLEKAGQYILVDQEISDEWICVTGVAFRDGLQAAEEKIAKARRDWIKDDLHEARVLWEDVVKILERRRQLPGASAEKSTSVNASIGLLIDPEVPSEKALDGAAQRVQQLFNRARASWSAGDTSCELLSALRAACGAVEDMQELLLEMTSQRTLQRAAQAAAAPPSQKGTQAGRPPLEGNPLDDELRQAGSYAWSQLDAADTHTFKFEEFLGCLDRCFFVLQSECGTSSPEAAMTDLPTEPSPPKVGMEVEVSGFLAPAEQSLNGQCGSVVSWHETEGMWQVQLQASGTRLLLKAEQLTAIPPAGFGKGQRKLRQVHRSAARSGSPRGSRRAKSLLELAEAAAARGDSVLVHHTVPWSE